MRSGANVVPFEVVIPQQLVFMDEIIYVVWERSPNLVTKTASAVARGNRTRHC